MTMSLRRSLIVLFILAIPLFFLRINDTHEWGDDFAQYIKEAQNIAHGQPFYRSGYVHNDMNTVFGPPQYPPGYPLIIAQVVGTFGLSFVPLMYLNTVLLVCLLFAFFFYFRKYTGDVTAICISLIGVYSSNIMYIKAQALSDLPCALFITLYLVLRHSDTFRLWRLVLLVLSALMAILTRSQALLLLGAEALYLLIDTGTAVWQTGKISLRAFFTSVPAKVITGVLLLYVLLNSTVFYTPASTMGFYGNVFNNGGGNLWGLVGYNANYLLDLLRSTFHFHTNDPFWQAPVTIMEYAGLVFMFAGFILTLRKKIRVDELYFILVCLMMLVLPVYQGYRYILSLLPLLLYYAFTGAKAFLPLIFPFDGRKIAIGVTLFYLVMGYDAFHSSLGAARLWWTPNTAADSLAFTWVKQHVSDSDIVIFNKPRLLNLYTDKKAMVLAFTHSDSANIERVKKVNARYVLVRKGLDDGDYSRFVAVYPSVDDSLRIDSLYMVYKIH